MRCTWCGGEAVFAIDPRSGLPPMCAMAACRLASYEVHDAVSNRPVQAGPRRPSSVSGAWYGTIEMLGDAAAMRPDGALDWTRPVAGWVLFDECPSSI